LPALSLIAGCAAQPVRVESRAPLPGAAGIVIVVDGAGGYQNAPRSISSAVTDARLPLEVRTFDWTHGRGFGLADEVDVEVALYHATRPGLPVYIVAYSAGCVVALAAAESVPPDGLERVVLLAPAVSEGYDLRPALAGARGGIDVFTSARDRFWLGVGTTVVGTADGRRQPAAGRVGFDAPADALASRLHQHPWDPVIAWTGNDGGHTGPLRPAYLKAYVLPLLSPALPR
jgi:hypothetical protein